MGWKEGERGRERGRRRERGVGERGKERERKRQKWVERVETGG